MSDLVQAEEVWHDWIVDACGQVDIDPASVDVGGIHDLTRVIAHEFERPMAPVGAFILGMAIGRHPDADRAALHDAIERTITERVSERG